VPVIIERAGGLFVRLMAANIGAFPRIPKFVAPFRTGAAWFGILTSAPEHSCLADDALNCRVLHFTDDG
jgi:hypothetical protein